MKIESKFQKKKPVLSFEIFPPKRDKAIQNIDETLAILSELNPDFISVTFGAGGSHTDNQTVELAKRIKQQYGIDPLVHLTCLNSSKFEICELLEELKEAEIDSILALRGDKNPAVEEKQDFRYASDLVKFIRQYGDFSISGACYPECHTESKNKIEDIAHLKEKVDSGVQHLISQLFFDSNAFYSFREHI
ncbi:MAG TPA: methylenetetrahydrofolate reductase, partial [Trichococcus flocculiformis]|nr:methylenetetrahydrofolate reductase [Trichococcus flocculiformis]